MTISNPFQDHFDRMAEQYKDAATEAIRSWTEAAHRVTGTDASQPDVSAIIDGAFDLAELHLRTHREFTKGLFELYVQGASAATPAPSTSDAAPRAEAAAGQNSSKLAK